MTTKSDIPAASPSSALPAFGPPTADEAAEQARAMFRRVLLGWTSDVLALRARGLTSPAITPADARLGAPDAPTRTRRRHGRLAARPRIRATRRRRHQRPA